MVLQVGPFNDAFEDMRDRYAEIQRRQQGEMDPREEEEREEAARAYTREQEKNYVDYIQDCLDSSYTANKDVREVQNECWRTFKEKEPYSYRFKEDWQSRITIPKPYASVMYGAAAVRKAFSPEFLTIENEQNEAAQKFWQSVLDRQLDKRHSKFVLHFIDAVVMALAVGQSMEVIPKYNSGTGLSFDLVEPWKIYRDPDAPPRNSQGGLFWIHQEWLDFHVLKKAEKSGKYHEVDKVKSLGEPVPNDPFMTREAIARRKDQIWERSKFRKMILTSEFWGSVLSPQGELLLENARMTMAGGRIIEAPKKSPYSRLRWPGLSFSALPDILSHGGRGLLEGNVRLWEAMCNLMCLHEDGLKFTVNPPTEINVDSLIDPEDIEDWPGKKYLTRDTMSGQQVVRTVERTDTTNSILANLQYHDQNFQRGSFVTDAVQGLPGYRAEVTAREAAQNLDQSMGIFSLMGANVENGAIDIMDATVDVMQTFAHPEELLTQVDDPEVAEAIRAQYGNRVPRLTGNFSISGLQELLKEQDTLRYLSTTIFPMASSPTWAPFIDRYKALRAFEARTNLKDEEIIIGPQQAQMVQQDQPMGMPAQQQGAGRGAAGGQQQAQSGQQGGQQV
ncbi:MAG: hypothetical protein ACOCQI_01730 [Desulfosalsimonas sp.]